MEAAVGTLLSVNVGMPKDIPWKNTTVFSGIYKRAVSGRRMVRALNIDGDGQGDLGGHGGEMRAVLVYQSQSYQHWADHLSRTDLEPGAFGENFTVDGLPDDSVCIGDRYQIGEAVFEVTQPRVTCYRVGMRLGVPQMAALLVSHRRPGFYLRVIQEGLVGAGDPIYKLQTGRHQLSVAAVDGLLYLPNKSPELLGMAVDIPALSPGWQQSFQEMLAAADSGEPLPHQTIGKEPQWKGFRPFVISRIVQETAAVTSLYLRDVTSSPLPQPKPGQYVTLRLPINGSLTVRNYSISGLPDASTYRISVKREAQGTVSSYLHERVHVGFQLDVAAPRGEFVLDDGQEPLLLISAGIGITPVLTMLASTAARTPERPIWWIHVSRSLSEYALAMEVTELLKSLPNADWVTYLTREASALRTQHVRAVSRRPDLNELSALHLPRSANAFICGPAGFISDFSNALTEIGLEPSRIHSELFGPAIPQRSEARSVKVHRPEGLVGKGPAVTFARSGLTVNWSDRYASLLELAEACDIPTRWSCRTGVCHNCVTGLLSGNVAYSPEPLDPPEPQDVLICCSQPEDALVLDA